MLCTHREPQKDDFSLTSKIPGLKGVVLTRGHFHLRGHLATFWRHFWLFQWGRGRAGRHLVGESKRLKAQDRE